MHINHISEFTQTFFFFWWTVPPQTVCPARAFFFSTTLHAGCFELASFISLAYAVNRLYSPLNRISSRSHHIAGDGTLYWNPKILHRTSENSIFLPGKQRRCARGVSYGVGCCGWSSSCLQRWTPGLRQQPLVEALRTARPYVRSILTRP